MLMEEITVRVAEVPRMIVRGTTLFGLRDAVKPGADVVVVNGVPVVEDREVVDGDAMVFIKRGEMPGWGELESLMMSRHTPGVHQLLKRASVGIAGLGGLGSSVAVSLARVGVGRLVLVDFDVVEPSNLNRQQYFVDQIGMRKTDALSETLLRVNPYVNVEKYAVRLTRENICSIFEGVQIVVEAFDNEESKAMLVETILRDSSHAKVVAASGMAGYDSANLVHTERIGSRFYLSGDRTSCCEPGRGLMAPRVGVVSQHQACMVLRLLVGEETS